MKKNKILFTLFLIGLFVSVLTISVNASVSAPNKTVQSGENVSITITSTTALESFDIKCEDTGGLTYKSCSSSVTGAVVNSSGKKISYAAVGGTKTLGTYNFTAPTVTEEKKYTVKFDVDGTTVSSVVTVKPKTTNIVDNNKNTETKKSNNANLKTLGVTPKQYDFSGFNKNKTEYSVTVPVSVNSLTVVAKAEDSKAKVNVSGNSGFETGSDNKITIKVTAEDGTAKTYTIKVTKLATDEEKPGNLIEEELYLNSLSITGIELSPAFSKDVFSYTATLDDESINEVTVNAKANNSKAKVEITGNKNLVNGENTINIVLTLDGETEQVVYQIVLNKIVGADEEGTIETNVEAPTQYTNDSKIKLYILIPIVVVVLIIVAIVVLIVLIVKENKRLDVEDNDNVYKQNDDKTSKAEEYNVFENDVNEFKGQSVEYSSKDMLNNEEENVKPNKKKGKHS